MTIKDIDLYRLRAEDLAKYLQRAGAPARERGRAAQMLIGGGKAAEC